LSRLINVQIETIGDAYCVAGGLHKKIDSHAKPIAQMALKMMELSEEVLTPDGKPIKVSPVWSSEDEGKGRWKIAEWVYLRSADCWCAFLLGGQR
jgi:hypothetical protein